MTRAVALAGAVLAGALGCAPAGGQTARGNAAELVSVLDRAGTDRLVPYRPAATVYESQPVARRQLPALDESLRARLFHSIQRGAADDKIRIVADSRLDAAMDDLARVLRQGEEPRSEAVEFLLAHYGVVEPYPVIQILRVRRASDAEMIGKLLQAFSMSTGDPLISIGVGVNRATSFVTVLVAVQPKHLDLDPVARTLPARAKFALSGRLLGRFRSPEIYMTDPSGKVWRFPLRGTPEGFKTAIACDKGDGRYQLEVFGRDGQGPRVLGNFPVYCGAQPPTEYRGSAGFVAERIPAETAEAELLSLVNRARADAGLGPVAADPALARVARAHSRDMMENDFVAHVSPRTGGPGERLEKAGIQATRVLENIGRAGSVEEAHKGLMRSPGHRSAILAPQVTHVGIGVVFTPPGKGAVSLLVTQLFR